MKYFLMLLSIFLLAGYVAADQYDHNYNSNHDNQYGYNQSFRQGYAEGFGHGSGDARARLDFNFRHSDEYQSSDDPQFRSGYAQGYADGFYGRSPAMDLGYGHGGYNQGGYDYGRDRDNDRDYRYGGSGSRGYGQVTVFTRKGFRGDVQSFGPGEYRLYGRFNDGIESIRVEGPVRVILFDYNNFTGRRIVLDRDAWDLGHFKDKAASMVIEPIGYRSGYGNWR